MGVGNAAMHQIAVGPLPGDPIAAAALFHAAVLPRIAAAGEGDLVLVFQPADRAHRAWRLAAVQGLARTAVPRRINAVATADRASLDAAVAYLAHAEGVTGQYLPLADCADSYDRPKVVKQPDE